MKDMSLQEHISALFAIATYYWLQGDDEYATAVLQVALQVHYSGHLKRA